MSSWRIYFVFFLIFIMGLGIATRIFYIQILKGSYYAALAQGQHVDYAEFLPPRGNIFFQDKFSSDSGLYLVATNKDLFLLYAVPKEITDARLTAARLTPVLYKNTFSGGGSSDATSTLNLDDLEENLYKRIGNKDDPYEPLARKLSKKEAGEIEALDLEGIYTKKEKVRYYPAEDLASQVIGFLGYKGSDRVGQYGLEGFYDNILRGDKIILETPILSTKESISESLMLGEDLVSSIDYNIQFMLEGKLKKAKEYLEADEASAIVMDPKTGEIIALATIDSFNPNNYSQVESIDIFLNGAVQKIFEPGSIFKPFTAAAAIDAGRISPTSKYNDTGAITIGKYTIRNSNGETYGEQSMTNVLEQSINTGAVFMEKSLGHDNFRKYMKEFKFGERTGIDLQGEVIGDIQNILYTSRDINFATASFGQGIAVTPIQLVVAFSAFANGGNMMKPHVVKELVSPDGESHPVEIEILASPISSKTAAQITSMLVGVVENGYGRKAAVKGYKVAGKTGTAQVPKENGKGYSEDRTIHSFIGFAPAYNPRFVALIKVDNPQGINFSADSVAPLFSEIAEYILNYYEIPPDN